ncbi:MAG TPA: hypothetical protein VF482_20870 [Trebonia sp.]
MSWIVPEITRIGEPFTGPERGILDGFLFGKEPVPRMYAYEDAAFTEADPAGAERNIAG